MGWKDKNIAIKDKESALRIAHQYVDNLSNKYEVLQAFVFGSFAKGTNHEDSDIAIAIVIKNASDIILIHLKLQILLKKIRLFMRF